MSHIPPTDIRHDIAELMPAVRRFGMRFTQNPAALDDLVQETLLKALAASESFEPGTRLKSWLFTILRNHYCSLYAKQKREVLGLGGFDTWMPTCAATQEWSLRGKDLQHAIDGLRGEHRDVIDLIVLQGKSYDEAAVIQGCPIGTIRSRVSRARDKLAFALGDRLQDAMTI